MPTAQTPRLCMLANAPCQFKRFARIRPAQATALRPAPRVGTRASRLVHLPGQHTAREGALRNDAKPVAVRTVRLFGLGLPRVACYTATGLATGASSLSACAV